jgi:hypothetical protein
MIFLKGVYVVAIAVVLILLIIVGVEAFYPGPTYPEYSPPTWDYNSTEYQEWEQQRTQDYAIYQQEAAVHHKNIFFIVLPLGVVFALVGTFIQRRLGIFGAGLILGGIGTMIFATVPDDLVAILRFIGIAATLAVLLFVGYKVFLSSRKSEHRL